MLCGLAWGGGRAIDSGYVTNYVTTMALSNAEKQKRWREKRNRIAKQASSVAGLIELLARSVRNKRDREIGVPVNRITFIINGTRAVTADRAAARTLVRHRP